jgi:hypothetical protein
MADAMYTCAGLSDDADSTSIVFKKSLWEALWRALWAAFKKRKLNGGDR